MTGELKTATNWWETGLSSEERVALLPVNWSEIGGTSSRHEKLLEMFRSFH